MKTLLRKYILVFLAALFVGVFSLQAQVIDGNQEGEPVETEDEKINKLVEKKRNYYALNKSFNVYKIQLYNGYEDQAYKVLSAFRAKYPEYDVEVNYKSPEWKTQIVFFRSRMQADRVLNKIRDNFVGAIVIRDKM